MLVSAFSGLAFASGSTSTAPSFNIEGMSSNGIAIGATTSTSNSVQTINYYMTGPSESNPTVISTMTTDIGSGNSNVTSASGAYAFASNLWVYPKSPDWNPNGPVVQTHSAGTGAANCASTPGCYMTSPVMSFVGVNRNSVVAGNADFVGSDVPLEGIWGSVYNRTAGTQTLLSGLVTGLSSTNYVSFDQNQYSQYNSQTGTSTIVPATINVLNPNLQASKVTDLGYGGFSSGVNSTGEVTGGVYTSSAAESVFNPTSGTPSYTPSSQYSEAFKTGANGVGTQLFGTANGIYSTGLAINSSGQVGGYITLASGQTEAFLSTARGGLMVGLGAGAPTDSTEVVSLSDSGQATIFDKTTNTYYLYSAGIIAPQANLTQSSSYYTTASSFSGVSGTVTLSSTSVFQAVSAAQGGATPTSTFYTDPSASTSSIALTSVGGSSTSPGVPAPAAGGLLLLALLGLLSLRKRQQDGIGDLV